MPLWNKRQNRLPKLLRPRTSQPDRPNRRWQQHCCSRCRPPRPTNCAAPPAGWPTGWRPMTTWRCRIWPTPWRVGVRTARYAPPSLRAACRSSPRRCARSPTATLRIRPRSDATTGVRCGCSPGRVRSGRRWAQSLLATEPVFAATVAQAEPLIAARVRVLGDRGDVGAADRDRYRPDPADAVHHAGCAGRHHAAPTACARARLSGIPWVRPRRRSSRVRCRWKTGCASFAGARG